MDAAMHVGVLLRVVTPERLDHDRRLLRGGGVVEVGQRAAMHGPPEDREILAQGSDVKSHRAERRRDPAGRNREATIKGWPAGVPRGGCRSERRRPDRR